MPRAGFAMPSNQKLLKARLTITEPKWNRNTHTWEVTIIVDLSYLDEPFPDAPILFFKDGKQLDEDIGKEPILTNSQGRATRDFGGLIPGKYRFEAFIQDTLIKGSDTKEIKGPQIELSLGEQESDGGKYKLAATAIAKTATGDPVSDVRVQFYKNERADGPPTPTDDHGRTEKGFLDLARGHYSFKAVIEGATTAARQSKEIKEDKSAQKEVGDISIDRFTKSPGEHTFTVRALDKEDRVLTKEPVFLHNPESNQPVQYMGTLDERGLFTFDLALKGERTEIKVTIGNKSKSHLIYRR